MRAVMSTWLCLLLRERRSGTTGVHFFRIAERDGPNEVGANLSTMRLSRISRPSRESRSATC
jgi:hypothetical protein